MVQLYANILTFSIWYLTCLLISHSTFALGAQAIDKQRFTLVAKKARIFHTELLSIVTTCMLRIELT